MMNKRKVFFFLLFVFWADKTDDNLHFLVKWDKLTHHHRFRYFIENFQMSNDNGLTNLVNRCRRFVCRGRDRASSNANQNRNINFNNGPIGTKFVSNRIATNKYTLITFLPKFLYEQFRKYSNVFFLCIVIFQVNPKKFDLELSLFSSKYPVFHQQDASQQQFL